MRCDTCTFFDEARAPRPAGTASPGTCRRYPPRLVGEDEDSWIVAFPPVDAELWCGEWQRRDDA